MASTSTTKSSASTTAARNTWSSANTTGPPSLPVSAGRRHTKDRAFGRSGGENGVTFCHDSALRLRLTCSKQSYRMQSFQGGLGLSMNKWLTTLVLLLMYVTCGEILPQHKLAWTQPSQGKEQ